MQTADSISLDTSAIHLSLFTGQKTTTWLAPVSILISRSSVCTLWIFTGDSDVIAVRVLKICYYNNITKLLVTQLWGKTCSVEIVKSITNVDLIKLIFD